MEMLETEMPEIVEEPCVDCLPPLDFSEFETWTQEKLLAAILAELITMRVSLTEMGAGISAIGSQGIGGMLSGLFGKSGG